MERQNDVVKLDEVNKLKVPELKAEAKRLGLKRYSKLRKQELINLISLASSKIPIPEIKITPPPFEPLSTLFQIKETASALKGFAKQFRIKGIEKYGPKEFMQKSKTEISRIMEENQQTKLKVILNCEMIREDPSASEASEILETYFHSEMTENLMGINIDEEINKFIETIEEKIQNFNKRGSNWRFNRVISFDLQMVEFKPLNGSSWLPLPDELLFKKAIINMKNKDNECFKWCATRALKRACH